jgi:hypothetical protein
MHVKLPIPSPFIFKRLPSPPRFSRHPHPRNDLICLFTDSDQPDQKRWRWHRGHRACDAPVGKHICHHYAEVEREPEAAPAEQFELAASVYDPSEASFCFAISHSP